MVPQVRLHFQGKGLLMAPAGKAPLECVQVLNRFSVSAASMGVRWMIGVTEIDKGSAYGNIDNKQKQID